MRLQTYPFEILKNENQKGNKLLYERPEVVMKCSKCGGMMVFEKFYSQEDRFFGWRCISCGEIIDPTILENRLQQKR